MQYNMELGGGGGGGGGGTGYVMRFQFVFCTSVLLWRKISHV